MYRTIGLRVTRCMHRLQYTRVNILHTKSTVSRAEAIRQELYTSLNAITGVSRVEDLKKEVQTVYEDLRKLRETLHGSKSLYSNSIEERGACQSEMNSLLQRKSHWNAADIHRFTTLCQSEHELILKERAAKDAVDRCEEDVDNKSVLYDSVLRERYQEEIILGERSKGIANMLTWSLLFLNTAIFLYSQLVTEPSRRRNMERKIERIIQVVEEPLIRIDTNVRGLVAVNEAKEEAEKGSAGIQPLIPDRRVAAVQTDAQLADVSRGRSGSRERDVSAVLGVASLAAVLLLPRSKS